MLLGYICTGERSVVVMCVDTGRVRVCIGSRFLFRSKYFENYSLYARNKKLVCVISIFLLFLCTLVFFTRYVSFFFIFSSRVSVERCAKNNIFCFNQGFDRCWHGFVIRRCTRCADFTIFTLILSNVTLLERFEKRSSKQCILTNVV